MTDYRIRLSGKASPELVPWLDEFITLLRVIPDGWEADVQLKRADPPDQDE